MAIPQQFIRIARKTENLQKRETKTFQMRPNNSEYTIQDQPTSQEQDTPADKRRKSQASRYKNRFQQVSESGGLELEDIETEIDEKGETKISTDGVLSGEREFRIPTFTLPRHPTKLYMLTVDVAKALGFRDSYLFLIRNPKFPRLVATDEDREALVKLEIMPTQLKNRTIAIATARSVFREFGHRIIKRGRAVRDDYLVGDRVTPPPDPMEKSKSFERLQDMSTSSSMEFQREGVTGIFSHFPYRPKDVPRSMKDLPPIDGPEGLKSDEWMYRSAVSAAEFNRLLCYGRPRRFMDFHTGIEHIPKASQPELCVLELSADKTGMNKVDSEIHVGVGKDPSHWIPVEPNQDFEKYPIAILPGQHQYAFSIFADRFTTPSYREPSPVPPPVLHLSESVSVAPQDNEESHAKKRARTVENVCGAKTNSGTICQRAVMRSGERCMHHQNQVESDKGDECIHCHEQEVPNELADAHPDIPRDLLLVCSSCNSLHHPSCIDFESQVLICKVQSYEWHCSNCKVCQICTAAGNDDKLLFCDTCDRGYHTFCLDPPLSTLPEGSWQCDLCTTCISCQKKQERTRNGRESMACKHVIIPTEDGSGGLGTYLCTYCKDCEKSFKSNRFCPLCLGVYAEDEETAMACCDKCDRWIHVGCDPVLTDDMYQELNDDESASYTCILCEKKRLNELMAEKQRVDPKLRKSITFNEKLLISPPIFPRKL